VLCEDDPLGPFEGVSVAVIGVDERVDLIAQLSGRGKAGAGQGTAGEDREPDFNLVEPRGVGRGEVKMDVLVARQPAIVFGLVGVQISKTTCSSRSG
jgi:hypothetical protein